MEREEIEVLADYIKQFFPRFDAQARWLERLSNFSLAVCMQAVDDYAKDAKFAPNFGDIYQLAKANNPRKVRELSTAEEVAYNRAMKAKGWVEARWTNEENVSMRKWFKVDECVYMYRQKRWVPKIEYVMSKLGGEEVTRRMKEELGGKEVSQLLGRKDWVANYKAWRDRLVEEAKGMKALGGL